MREEPGMNPRSADFGLGIGALLLGGVLSAVVSSFFGLGGALPTILTLLFTVLIVVWGLRRNAGNGEAR
jgi:hypothetical protein